MMTSSPVESDFHVLIIGAGKSLRVNHLPYRARVTDFAYQGLSGY